MCGIIGMSARAGVAANLLAGLSFLQHRGQDACGIAAMDGNRVFIEKGRGFAEQNFDEARLARLPGNAGIAHVRYSTSGDSRALSEIQPFYVNQPFGITLAHNGNLVNVEALRKDLGARAQRHIGTESDTEALLNVLANALAEGAKKNKNRPLPELLFDAVAQTHRRCEGSYSAVALVAGGGLLAFRDSAGIRPLSFDGNARKGWLVASESAAFRPLGFYSPQDVAPGEAIFIDAQNRLWRRRCAPAAAVKPRPCLFEYIYLARPDSVLDGISVYQARLNMGRALAKQIKKISPAIKIDCVVPVPDSGRVAAMEAASALAAPYREGMVKNRHSPRVFISADPNGEGKRGRLARKKLNVIAAEIAGKNVLLVDDSIVRGDTARELVALARAAGARRVYFASAAPPIRFPNVYGIDIPTRRELLAAVCRGEKAIAAHLGADRVIYTTLPQIVDAVSRINPAVKNFETSCFDGKYLFGDVSAAYLRRLEKRRGGKNNILAQGRLPLAQ